MSQHERLVDRHIFSVRSIRTHEDTAKKTTGAVEECLQTVYAQCLSPDSQVGKCLKRLRDLVKGEQRAVEVEDVPFMGERFEDLINTMVYFLT